VPPFGKWQRTANDPILQPRGDGFESAGVFNPSVVMKDGKFAMLYRAQDHDGVSRLGYATSTDGIHFIRNAEPVLAPEAEYEKGGGVEDPRLVKVGDIYFLTYTGYNKQTAQLCLATSRDLIHWERQGVILPAYKGRWNVGWTKSGAIVSEKIDDKYWMYYLGETKGHGNVMGVASSPDLLHWSDSLDHPVLDARPGQFDSTVVEPGPAPIVLPEGIFLIYNGADAKNRYATGWALFDKTNPSNVLARSERPIFSVEREWEHVGQVPNVVFVEGLVRQPGRWLFYYGGADKYVGVAIAPVRNGL